MDKETQTRIRAAGAVQAVVASGMFEPEEWREASLYVVSLTGYVTARIMGRQGTKMVEGKKVGIKLPQPVPPRVPKSLKERTHGR